MVIRKHHLLIAFLIIAVFCSALTSYYWISTNHKSEEGFGIFLSENNTLVISDQDIIWYNVTSHEVKLTQSGADKIDALNVSVFGTQFVAKIDGREIYKGTFMTPISSVSAPPSNVVIETFFQNNTIKIQIGYPPMQPPGKDPRINSEIFNHFQNLNKLVQ